MTAPSLADVAAAHETLAAYYRAQAAGNDNQSAAPNWIPQKGSLLGSRRHIAAVRRLVALGSSDARIVGRRYLLSQTALEAELGTVSGRSRAALPSEPAPVDELAALRARYATPSRKATR